MSLVDQIQKDITTAMKARAERRLSTLRMVKTALKKVAKERGVSKSEAYRELQRSK